MALTEHEPVKWYEKADMISEVRFRSLMGELQPEGGIICTVIGCDSPAICRVGCGRGHPSCERHAKGEDHISPLNLDE